jgi:hypothetical protein
MTKELLDHIERAQRGIRTHMALFHEILDLQDTGHSGDFDQCIDFLTKEKTRKVGHFM